MKPILFYDSETSGLPLFDQPSEDPAQPHVVQLAACLVDVTTRKTIQSMDVIINPDGWVIPDEVAKIHGITTEYASQVGVSESLAVVMLMELWAAADQRVGHNESFDARIIRIALMRFNCVTGMRDSAEVADAWKSGKAECTARLATPYCKLPPTEKMLAVGRKHHKTATLSEAYRHFVREELQDAHSAMVDVRACMAVYFAIQDLKAPLAGLPDNQQEDDIQV